MTFTLCQWQLQADHKHLGNAWPYIGCVVQVVATGWNYKVFVWDDSDEFNVEEYRSFLGHR